MKTQRFFHVALAIVALAAPSQATAQLLNDGPIDNFVAWFTGDPNVGLGPTPPGAAPPDAPTCSDGTCGCCSQCCRRDVWGTAEFLMWWGQGSHLPALVTTSPAGTPIGQAGVLGVNGTTTLFGQQLGGQKLQGGGRLTAGIWLDPDHNVAAGGRFFGLGGDTTRFAANSDAGGNPILAVPFFNTLINQQDSFKVAYPGLTAGGVSGFLTTNNIIGAEAFAEVMMMRDAYRRIDLVGGYQFLRLNDWLQLNTNSTVIQQNNLFFGQNAQTTDRFSARNEFHGGEVGLRARMARGQWSLNVLGLAGLGNMNEQVTISGSNTFTPAGGTPTTRNNGGLLTAPTNIGTYTQNKFAFIPQLTMNLNYHITPSLSVLMGYNMIWMTNIATAGQQVDSVVNPGFPGVGPARPQFVFHDQNYWLQGINFGGSWDF